MQFKNGRLGTICHNYVANEWGDICTSALTQSVVAYEPLINYGGKQKVTRETVTEPEKEDTQMRKEEERKGADNNLMDTEKEDRGEKDIHIF